MRKNILRTLALAGLFFFASLQLLPLVGTISLGFELFPRWSLIAVGVGLLVFGCGLAGLLRLEHKNLFDPQEKGKERLSTWLLLLGVNAIIEAFSLFFLNMIVVQPLSSWLNGTFQVEELVISFIFFLVLVVGGMIVVFFSWILPRSGKQAKGKE